MKKKMFAMLTISFMVMAAFGAVAVFAEDTAADDSQRVINEASGTVNYIPDVINVSVGGTASFIPTVNWIVGNVSGYSVSLEMKTGPIDSASAFDISVEGAPGAEGYVAFGVISINGLAKSTTSEKFEVNVKAVVTKGSDSITVSHATKQVTVNVYDKISFNTDDEALSFDTHYFGETYSQDLSTYVVAGANAYVMTVSGLPEGLYLLGTTVTGMAYAGSFTPGSVTVTVNVVDTVTGASAQTTAIISLQMYEVTVKYGDAEVKDGDNLLVKQGEAAKFTYNLTGAPDGATITFESEHLEFSNESNPVTVALEIIGDHLVMVSYEADGHVYNALTFTMSVVYSGIDFIVPEPGMVVTLTG